MPYKRLPASRGYILCYSASGAITAEDYTNLLIPDVERAHEQFGKARILLDITNFSVTNMDWAAMWQDAKFGFKMGKIERFALICHHRGISFLLKAFLIGSEYQAFSVNDRLAAFDWIFEGSNFSMPDLTEEEQGILQAKNDRIPFIYTSRYLVALDSAEPARCALAQAMHLLRGEGSEEIHLMTVITDDCDADTLQDAIANASKLVQETYEGSEMSRLQTFEHVVHTSSAASIAKAIIDVSMETNADYIIIGTQRADKKSSLSNSVCVEVIGNAKCPVLVCKAGQETPYQKKCKSQQTRYEEHLQQNQEMEDIHKEQARKERKAVERKLQAWKVQKQGALSQLGADKEKRKENPVKWESQQGKQVKTTSELEKSRKDQSTEAGVAKGIDTKMEDLKKETVHTVENPIVRKV